MKIGGYSPRLCTDIAIGKKVSVQDSNNIDKAMNEEYLQQVREQARKDAKKGKYGSDQLNSMITAQKKRFVSPNRSFAIAKATTAMNQARMQLPPPDPFGDAQSLLDILLGENISMDAYIGFPVTTAIVYGANGEEIASYNSQGGWVETTTSAENAFISAVSDVYSKEWDAANAEIKAGRQAALQSVQQSAPESSDSTVDIRV